MPITKKLITVPLTKLIPYEQNTKIHTDNVEEIAKSIQRNEYITPIIIDEKFIILAWHGRTLALQHLWESKTQVIQVTGLTEEQKKDFRISDNKIAELSEWNIDMLQIELKGVSIELQELFPDIVLEEIELDEETEDIIPGIEEWVDLVQFGDLFKLWNHYLLCGDATSSESIDMLMQWKKADCVFTDPPYNVNYKGKGKKTKRWIKNDHMSHDAFTEFLTDSFKQLFPITNPTTPLYIFHSHTTQIQFQQCLESSGFDVKKQLIRNKTHYNRLGYHYKQKHEPFFYCVQHWSDPEFYGWISTPTVVEDGFAEMSDKELLKLIKQAREHEEQWSTSLRTIAKHNVNDYDHPTQKPVALIELALLNSSKPHEIVVDFFWWSGSTLNACEKTNRVCYTMELEPHFVQVIIKRYHTYTKGQREIRCLNRDLDLTSLFHGEN